MGFLVVDENRVFKALEKLPKEIRAAYSVWRKIILTEGFLGLRRVKGFHFEKLKGSRVGQYSCRLNRGFRVIFQMGRDKVLLEVLEVNKHDY
ncbi:MAG: type II toxin-antitoxin system RelE/ParE family toxin [Pseudomonadota bacterium]